MLGLGEVQQRGMGAVGSVSGRRRMKTKWRQYIEVKQFQAILWKGGGVFVAEVKRAQTRQAFPLASIICV